MFAQMSAWYISLGHVRWMYLWFAEALANILVTRLRIHTEQTRLHVWMGYVHYMHAYMYISGWFYCMFILWHTSNCKRLDCLIAVLCLPLTILSISLYLCQAALFSLYLLSDVHYFRNALLIITPRHLEAAQYCRSLISGPPSMQSSEGIKRLSCCERERRPPSSDPQGAGIQTQTLTAREYIYKSTFHAERDAMSFGRKILGRNIKTKYSD